MDAKIHIGAYIFAGSNRNSNNCKVNGRETLVELAFDESTHLSMTGMLSLAVIETEKELRAKGMVFGRGWTQPEGIRDSEAFKVGEDIGAYLRSQNISQYELLENENMLDDRTSWFAGDLKHYRRGIESILESHSKD